MYEEQISSTPTPGENQPSTGEPDKLDTGAILGRFMETADVKAVYNQPTQVGESTVIPAAEVFSVLGFGGGYGAGGPNEGSGGGSGGGGRTFARPVAVVVARPDGVEVRPVFDITKIALAAITTWGFMAFTVARIMRGRSRRMPE